ncbi:MAG: hypothetical protein GWP10_14295 [Nitrospiraceae bacterium]|nr:hypothetical protein [Nitrospiraceae bacterium]
MTRVLDMSKITQSRLFWAVLIITACLIVIPFSAHGVEILFDETRLQDIGIEPPEYGVPLAFSIDSSSPLGISYFVTLLKQKAYNIAKIGQGQISASDLGRADVLVILQPDSQERYSLSEVMAIQDFVRDGGSLFLSCGTSDSEHRRTEGGGISIAQAFGVVTPPYGVLWDASTHGSSSAHRKAISSLADHAITQGVHSFFCGRAYLGVQDTAAILATTDRDS